MELSVEELLQQPFETSPFKVKGRGISSVQVTEEGVLLNTEELIPLSEIQGWQFADRQAAFSLSSDREIIFRSTRVRIDQIRRQFNLLRLSRADKGGVLEQCPHCDLFFDATDQKETRFCPECFSMVTEDDTLCIHNGYHYNFSSSGLFSLVGPDARHRGRHPLPIDEGAFATFHTTIQPLFQKLFSHLLWFLLWIAGWWGLSKAIGYAHYDATTWVGKGVIFLHWTTLALSFFSVLMAGSYLTLLYFRGAFRALLRPTLWNKMITLIERGKVDEAAAQIQAHHLDTHPGMMANLALGYFWRADKKQGKAWLNKALALCPSQPALQQIAKAYGVQK